MFFEQVKMSKGIPFELKIPNQETIQAMKDAQKNDEMEITSIDELKNSLLK